jgi:hypothetical protein
MLSLDQETPRARSVCDEGLQKRAQREGKTSESENAALDCFHVGLRCSWVLLTALALSQNN